ncbi:MAG: hypothetical protein PHC84_04310, partial [Clostridia bacterium]|nr:hypothetical protein [Clostridia bacterium]
MKSKTGIRISIIMILIAVTIAVTAAFGLFTNEKPFVLDAESGEASATFSELNIIGQTVFSEKGDTYNATFAVENTGGCAFDYSLELWLPEKAGLENAVLLYIDGQFRGTLGQIFASQSQASFEVGIPLYPGEKYSHNVTLEYHLGAGDYYSLAQKDFSLKIGGKATQLFREKDHIIFVRDTYELLQVVDNFNYAGYTMRLAGNIALTGDLVFDKPVNLDLAGHAIDCGAHSIIFDYESSEASRLFSSRPSV